MKRVYELEANKKAEITKILEADPYSQESFARAGYKLRDGATLGEDKAKIYLYISAADDFIKKADEKLKGIATPLKGDAEKKIIDKIIAEEENAEAGLGGMFG
jgi:hypothetical protein